MGSSNLRQFLNYNSNDPIFFIGTRAELIKVAPVITKLDEASFPVRILWAGLHSEEVLNLTRLQIVSLHSLRKTNKDLDSIGGVLIWFLQNMIQVISYGVLARFSNQKPKIVVVHGDTLCTVLGSLLAKASGANLMHIEAGVRSGKFWRPFPEEISRRLVSRVTDIHFAPGEKETENLRSRRGEVVNTIHNTSLDALSLLVGNFEFGDQGYLVVTLHRTELLSNKRRFSQIVEKIIDLSKRYDVKWYVGNHEKAALHSVGLLDEVNHSQINLLQRTNHLEFMKVVTRSHCVITDSGGLQSECNDLGIPVIVHRNESEYSNPDRSPCVLTNWEIASIDKFLLVLKSQEILRGLRTKVVASEIIAKRITREITEAK